MTTLANYQQCSCGADCPYLDNNPDEPCYGEVEAIGEDESNDWEWVHACEGHRYVWDGYEYAPAPVELREGVIE